MEGFNGLVTFVGGLFACLAIFLLLGVWKLVEIVFWCCHYVKIGVN